MTCSRRCVYQTDRQLKEYTDVVKLHDDAVATASTWKEKAEVREQVRCRINSEQVIFEPAFAYCNMMK